ncbi:single-stranded DNA-binding protein [Proteus phage PM2]|uniref:Single-stranded DNA-binding protein n=1 Tax=Proteus phage PM2 TaxID=2025809 RepID=A0A249XY87_9CAUD|nr:UvsY-like recombination mediator [Proteus phage PM2]ASZ76446.1 single-stranded DNA-binding protein [Proteus phage PM2]
MNLEELQTMLSEDLKIDSLKLQYEAANNPSLYAKWLKIYSDIKKGIISYEANKKRLLKQRLDHYTGRGDEVCMDLYEKSELKTVIAADPEILKTQTSVEYRNLLLDFASKALDAIKARGFSIKHILECRQFEAGTK